MFTHKKIYKRNDSFLLTSFLFFVLATVLFLTFFLVYQNTCQNLETIAVKESSQTISKSVDTIDSALTSTVSAFTNSTLNKLLNNTLKKDALDLDYGTLFSLREDLLDYFTLNHYIQDLGFFINSSQKDYLCTVNLISDDFEKDYDNHLYDFEEMDYSDFKELLINSKNGRYIHTDYFAGYVSSHYSRISSSGHLLFLVYPLNFSRSSMQVYALMQLNLDKLCNELLSSRYCSSAISLYDRNEQIFTTDHAFSLPETSVVSYYNEATDIWYIQETIPALGLTSYVALDKTEIYAEISPFTRLLFYFFIIMVVSLCLFTYFLFRYWFLPVFRMANAIPDIPEAGNYALSKINHQLDLLTTQKETAISKLSDYQLHDFLRLLYTNKELAEDTLALAVQKFSCLENNFRCICIGSLDSSKYTLPSDSFTPILDALSITIVGGTFLDNNFVGIILQNDNMVYHGSSDFYKSMNRLLDTLNEKEASFAIGVSDVYNGYFSVSSAYDEAFKSWKNAMLWQNAAVVFSSALSEYGSSYQVNYMQLDALYRTIISNQKEKSLALYDQLLLDNFGNLNEHHLRTLYWQQFENDIIGVLIRISTQFDIYAIIESYLSQTTRISLFKRIEYLRNAIIQSIELIPAHNSENDMANAIYEYCAAHYNDYQLSLSTLSEEFHLSPSSLSKFFKAHFGISPSAYIERLRIDQAQKLIVERNFTIQEIAAQVGYQNITTFYNAFKKNKKCTPTEWREQQENLSALQ